MCHSFRIVDEGDGWFGKPRTLQACVLDSAGYGDSYGAKFAHLRKWLVSLDHPVKVKRFRRRTDLAIVSTRLDEDLAKLSEVRVSTAVVFVDPRVSDVRAISQEHVWTSIKATLLPGEGRDGSGSGLADR